MAAAFKTDKDLRQALALFFTSAHDDVQPPGAEASAILGHPFWRLTDGVWFRGMDATADAEAAVVSKVTRLLGPVASHERDASDLLWHIVARRASGRLASLDAAVAAFLEALEDNATRERVYIDANHLFAFEAGLDDIQIGPVRAVKAEVVEAELGAKLPGRKWEIAVGAPSFQLGGEKVVFNVPPILWQVSLRASLRTLKEQAAWLVDIATSLLRLRHREIGPNFPSIGDLEGHPLMPGSAQDMAMIMTGGDMVVPGAWQPGIYRVDAALRAITQAEDFQQLLAIFEPRKNSVAERVAQGLGWMARGRRAPDRAERLLYFFTAIEALLSSDDKTAPVTQTIARHAAVILAERVEYRADIAGQLRALYAARSALVHAGKRGVSQSETDTVQYWVETLYAHVLDEVDLAKDFQAFSTELSQASYGGAWPPPQPAAAPPTASDNPG